MKVIGKTGNSGFLVEISSTEVANLMGEYSAYQSNGVDKLSAGDTININEMYMRVRSMSAMLHQLEQAKATLRVLEQGLNLVEPTVKKVVEIIGEVK